MEPDHSRPPVLPPGIYDRLITRGLEEHLERLLQDGWDADRDRLDAVEAPARLSKHVGDVVRRVLEGISEPGARAEVVGGVLDLLHGHALEGAMDERVADTPEPLLRAVQPAVEGPGRLRLVPPVLGVGQSDLLVNARGEPNLLHSLVREIGSADRIDVVVAFIKFSGLRPLLEAFGAATGRGAQIRVLTTTYLGGSDARAISALAELGAQVKVSYELGMTRLHAKGWLFERNSGFHTAFIGSSNLSHAAMTQGQEWNVRLASAQTPELVQKFRAAFAAYWDDPALGFDVFDAADPLSRERLEVALRQAGGGSDDGEALSPFHIRPYPHQAIMLEDLDREREVHGRHRNLVVAATGTGKTAVAGFDYARLAERQGGGVLPRLLFVAHRKEILKQSRRMFRQILRRGDFGELLVGDDAPRAWEHVFASVQSLTPARLAAIDPEAFDVIVVDEFHHAAAPSYVALLERMRPGVLLGLTATPERLDGRDVTGWFDGHVATELRLWDALEQQLLSPFHYYGVGHDSLDFRRVRWSGGHYLAAELDNLVTGDQVIADWVVAEIRDKVTDPGRMRALAFACTVRHAEFLAGRFTRAGWAALAIHGGTPAAERAAALEDLRRGTVQVVVTVDLFNEGVDVPEIDTVLMLRPTESATVFLQQLGRGLRRSDNKDVLTVLDFIGFQDQRFRFDLRYRALTGVTRHQLTRAVTEGFPYLPAGSFIALDRVAQEAVLDNVRAHVPTSARALVEDVRRHATATGRRRYELGDYLGDALAEPADIYGRASLSWSQVCRRAGLEVPEARSPVDGADEEQHLLSRVRGLVHVDDRARLIAYRSLLEGGFDHRDLTVAEQRLATMLYFSIWPSGRAPTPVEGLRRLRAFPAVTEELRQVWDVAEQRIPHVTHPLRGTALADSPLRVHARYTREEMLAGLGWAYCDAAGGRPPRGHAAGTREVKALNADAFDITWQKSERAYSPTTMYRDYAISPREIHWESPNSLAADSATTARYVQHETRHRHILLFAREAKRGPCGTRPLMFLGPASYVSHEGERPVSFRWSLHRPLPTEFFETARVVSA